MEAGNPRRIHLLATSPQFFYGSVYTNEIVRVSRNQFRESTVTEGEEGNREREIETDIMREMRERERKKDTHREKDRVCMNEREREMERGRKRNSEIIGYGYFP